MAYYFAEGSAFYFSTTFAATKAISVLTNANPAVATATSHGYTTNDEILLASGWEDATDNVFKITVSDANTFSLGGLNSVDTNFYASGAGTGTGSKISSWLSIPQVLSISSNGGDARFTSVELLSRRNATQVPTGFNAASFTLTLAHDPSATNYSTMLSVSRGLTKCAFKLVGGGGATSYGYGYMSVSEVPQMARNQVNTVQCAVTLLNRFISY